MHKHLSPLMEEPEFDEEAPRAKNFKYDHAKTFIENVLLYQAYANEFWGHDMNYNYCAAAWDENSKFPHYFSTPESKVCEDLHINCGQCLIGRVARFLDALRQVPIYKKYHSMEQTEKNLGRLECKDDCPEKPYFPNCDEKFPCPTNNSIKDSRELIG